MEKKKHSLNYFYRFIPIFLLLGIIISLWTSKKEKIITLESQLENVEDKRYAYQVFNGVVQRNGDYTKFDYTNDSNITVYFEKDEFSIEKMNRKVSELQTLVEFMLHKYNALDESSISIYIGSNMATYGVASNAYIALEDVSTEYEILAIIQALTDETVNYGLCYGMSVYFAKEAGYILTKTYEFIDIKEQLERLEDSNILDLTIPVFEPVYFSVEQNATSYQIAVEFTAYLISTLGEKGVFQLMKESAYLENSFQNNFSKAMNQWLLSMDIDVKYTEIPVSMSFVKNHSRDNALYPYIIKTSFINAYFETDAVDDLLGNEFTYSHQKEYIIAYVQDTDEVMEYLSNYFSMKEAIDSYFYNDSKKVSYYSRLQNTIKYVYPYYAATHEYVHYITVEDNLPAWLTEGLATYCDYYIGDESEHRLLNSFILLAVKRLEGTDIYDEFVRIYSKCSSQSWTADEIDLSSFSDSLVWLTYRGKFESTPVSFNQGIQVEDGDELSYFEAASMIKYLITTYGKDTFFSMYTDHGNLEKYYNKSYCDIKDEWIQYMKELCKP